MPHRLVCLAILVLWLGSVVALFRRDILPGLILGPPPDLRTVTQSAPETKPTRWAIIISDPAARQPYRPIGQIVSHSLKRIDGSAQWSSEAWFDAAELVGHGQSLFPGAVGDLPDSELQPEGEGHDYLFIQSVVEVDSVGNLFHLRTTLRGQGDSEDLVTIEGHLVDNELEIQTNSPMAMLRSTRRLPYRSRGLVENPLSPMDRLPGLKIGQRWETRMANPLTGGAQEAKSEVVASEVIPWNNDVVRCLVVVTRVPPLSYKTWVRPDDGLVLRQEVPYPLARLMLERLNESAVTITPGVLP
ncbi:MAG: hypothetical protein U0800_11595 [Isosphaeraceae bacterium]